VVRARLVGLLVGAVVAAGCTGGGGDVHAVISARPASAVLDRAVSVDVSGLPMGARTTVTASATDARGTRWSSSAEFTASGDGTVSLDAPPVSGSYSGANPMGLLQSMTPPAGTQQSIFAPRPDGYDVSLQVSVDGKPVASTELHRLAPAAAGVTTRDLRVPTDGIYGTLYRPKDSGTTRRPAVLYFGGSEGGLSGPLGAYTALLASHGYPALALAYFKEPGLPATLTRVPLEYFTKALAVLRAQPGVDPRRVYVMGASRGGEAALLLGATFPRLVNGVVAFVPGSYVNSAIPDGGDSAWTLAGRELPYAPFSKFGAPAASVDPRAVIQVERIAGPVLLTCGELDLEWPSCSFVDDVTQRLTAHHFRHPVTVLRYPDGGHFSGDLPPGAIYTSQAVADVGGTVAAAQQSGHEAEAKILALLGDR
jgi:dienelactone hydrolase